MSLLRDRSGSVHRACEESRIAENLSEAYEQLESALEKAQGLGAHGLEGDIDDAKAAINSGLVRLAEGLR